METLKLTTEQKEKLMEMTIELFPECVVYFDPDVPENLVTLDLVNKNNEEDWCATHWFELCMYHLPVKIKEDTQFLMNWMVVGLVAKKEKDRMHPVDYLYEKYKKIKENERVAD